MDQLDFQITIAGGGNLAHASVACIGHHCPGVKINVLTRRPKEWGKSVVGQTKDSIWAYKGIISGKIQCVSDDPAEVVPGSRIVIIASPNHVREDILERAAPHLSEDTMVGSVYGSGGFDLMGLSVLGESFA